MKLGAPMGDGEPRTVLPVGAGRLCSPVDGGSRIIVARHGAEAVRGFNGAIATGDELARRTNPDATRAPKATGIVAVYGIDSRACHFITLHRFDPRPRRVAAVGNVVVFSHPKYAPSRTKNLQLATPGYYRDQEDLQPGIRDPHDGTLAKDGSRWASSIMGGTVSARLTFASKGEPWVYCASHYSSDIELRRLRGEFDAAYGYSAATSILDPSAFAERLGIDFALGLDKTADVSLEPIDRIAYAHSRCTTSLWEGSRPIDSFVRVHYGPVNYEDASGRVDKQEQWFDPHAGPLAWFTKKNSFAKQSEYRFAVSTLGAPVEKKLHIKVSQELRELTRAV